MDKNQLLDALVALLPAQLEILIFKLDVPPGLLPGPPAPAGSRCTDLLRWVDQANQRAKLEALLEEVKRPPAQHPQPPRFQHLPPETITALHSTAIRLGLASSRTALLAGIDQAYTTELPVSPSPSAQLSSDLEAMNLVERLSDGSVPLRSWLSSALRLTSIRQESAVFRGALAVIEQKGP